MDLSLKRTFDVGLVNYIINHDDVREGARLKGKTDFTIPVKDENNYCLFNKYGGFIFQKMDDGVYEVHTQFLKKVRGPHVLLAARKALNYMFDNAACKKVTTSVYKDNTPAIKLTKAVKFKECENSEGFFKFELDAKTWKEG